MPSPQLLTSRPRIMHVPVPAVRSWAFRGIYGPQDRLESDVGDGSEQPNPPSWSANAHVADDRYRVTWGDDWRLTAR